MENTLENKAKFFAQYFAQVVYNNRNYPEEKTQKLDSTLMSYTDKYDFLTLKTLLSIADEDLIHVARLAHERPGHDFKVTRNKDIFYVQTDYDRVGINYFISMMPRYASVCATMNFAKYKDEGFKSYTINIGKVNLSSERPIAYIAIVDYLRSKGYALPWMGLSVEKQIEYGWIKLKEA
ncbi:hypothetical protein [Pedobacter duraquae]|uniref:Uncharacterized protein n=1 Tax=Pedobacter duraquae TaxID=425511 RepID=A0A4R6IIW8_9SPHI|nr:hypothetical protein [Pedobacter duraquae]TDO21917.1 hypothetical protein CLV32_3025 [Pedobacter duraquae]